MTQHRFPRLICQIYQSFGLDHRRTIIESAYFCDLTQVCRKYLVHFFVSHRRISLWILWRFLKHRSVSCVNEILSRNTTHEIIGAIFTPRHLTCFPHQLGQFCRFKSLKLNPHSYRQYVLRFVHISRLILYRFIQNFGHNTFENVQRPAAFNKGNLPAQPHVQTYRCLYKIDLMLAQIRDSNSMNLHRMHFHFETLRIKMTRFSSRTCCLERILNSTLVEHNSEQICLIWLKSFHLILFFFPMNSLKSPNVFEK